MSGFSADWLALREPFDAAARAAATEASLALWAKGRGGPLRIVDLGAGTGANLRHLAPCLPVAQAWTLVEHDPALIAAGEARLPATGAVRAAYRRADLVAELEAVLEEPCDLVTCSALLDLVSADWLERLVRIVRARDLALLAVLTYDGRVHLEPAHPLDEEAIALVNRHQRTDKGFGPALGPEAGIALARALHGAGDAPLLALSDWDAGPGDRAFQRALVEGWAEAASAIAPERAPAIDSWRRDRLRAIEAGGARARVGHVDLLRLPRGQGRAP
ncbi:MAG: class I SAM-dependent methyltransferase [Geminicoccaceae bacterium]|nr:class I SAM-dependent methyltransferase [Geminicoccaceae bacterium]MCX8101434.1 class I SAM-dependent methyltransferase [Geminicoccaceae bacterium]MDW8370401.1 class I SAM-dependent methyltransferase [Geminicoccaceae bacterium]